MPRPRKDKRDGIYQHPRSPYWWASIPDGHSGRARRSTGILVKDDPQGLKATALRAAWIAEQKGDTDAPPNPSGETFDGLLLAYLKAVTPSKSSPERDYYSAKRLRPHFTGRTLAEIGAAEVRSYIALRKAAGISPGTLNKEIGFASAAWNWAKHELELPISNPWQSRRQSEPAGRTRWLTRNEINALLKAANANRARPHLVPFITLCLHAGLRPGEALRLSWDRVDFSRGRILFGAIDSKNAKHAEVPISKSAHSALIERARFRAEHCPDSPWVFCRRNGQRIAKIRRSFDSAAKAAGLSDVHPHDLRRTCGSWLVQAGIGIERVSAVLRHSDIRVTERVYAHLRPSDVADALGALENHEERYNSSHLIVTPDSAAIIEAIDEAANA